MKIKKRIFRTIAYIPFIVLGITLIVLSIKFSPTYVYRLITMNVADVYDYKNFENRKIREAKNTKKFVSQFKEEYVESLFDDLVTNTGFKSFEEWAIESQTTALIVIQKDIIIYEKYFNGFNRDSYFHSQSMAKSFISFLIGSAIDDGLIQSVEDPITNYIPELLKRDQRFQKISIKNLLEMRSGLEYNTDLIPFTNIHAPWHDEAVGYYHPNVRKLLLEDVEVSSEPGKDFQYSNYNTSYLGLIIERATNLTVSDYLEQKLWSKIMEYDALFSLDSKKSGFEYMPSRLIARAIDYARFGQLMLHEGDWYGNQIISKNWVQESTQENKSIPRDIYPKWFGRSDKRIYYNYQWWGHVNKDGTFHFYANGNLGQNIYINPNKETVIVHCGNSLQYYSSDFDLWNVSLLLD
ncbi:serine hydrolase domain-containing protein [Aquimarina litoralis]|uniref:serine hydrolase domain-containing protein n=1 Tax=Aquimarina litoralis TaxID=584605 RepID=UPI001C57E069|nr:serine hydrolase [Aquimarina litoralis]MBW1294805.1 serine hydrolase [Aquimarina litoralis]